MTAYRPGTRETDQKKQNMAVQQLAQQGDTNTTNIATNTASIATLQATVGYGYFSVNRNGTDQTSATAGAFNKVKFTTEAVDSQSFFDPVTNNRYQPTQAGWYYFFIGTRAASAASGTSQAAIYKNGSAAARGNSGLTPISGDYISTTAALVQLNGSTDYVEGFCFLPTGVTTISGVATDTFMLGYRVA